MLNWTFLSLLKGNHCESLSNITKALKLFLIICTSVASSGKSIFLSSYKYYTSYNDFFWMPNFFDFDLSTCTSSPDIYSAVMSIYFSGHQELINKFEKVIIFTNFQTSFRMIILEEYEIFSLILKLWFVSGQQWDKWIRFRKKISSWKTSSNEELAI